MSEFKKHFEFFSEIQSELTSQMFVINFIKSKYYSDYEHISRILQIDNNPDDIFENNQEFIIFIENLIDKKIDDLSSEGKSIIPVPDWLSTIDQRSIFGELIQYSIDYIESSEITEEIYNDNQFLFETIKKDIQEMLSLVPVDELECSNYTDGEIYNAIFAAKLILNNEKANSNEEIEDILLNFKTTLRLLDNFSASNIFRQSFINIFSIFDAVTFDTLTTYFKNNPNELEKFFNPNNSTTDTMKLSFEDILSHSDLISLHSTMVEMRFSGKYLSNIIRLIAKYKPAFFDQNYKISNILEAVNRRNLHIHKKGIVDTKYVSEMNIFNLKEGDLAHINQEYYTKIFNLISTFDSKLSEYFK